jgi:signal transduction histidine kinase
MVKTKFPQLDVDQMICGLRWLLLLLAPVLAYLDHLANQKVGVDLTLILWLTVSGLVYNLIATLLIYLEFFPTVAAWSFLILDVVLSIGFLVATDFSIYPLLTIGLFATLQASLRFDLMVGIGVAVILAFPAGLGTILTEAPSLNTFLPPIVGLAALLLVAGSAGALMSRTSRMITHARDEELQALQRVNERARAIYQMVSTLSATLDYQQAMEAILDISLMGLEKLGSPEQKPVGMLLLYGDEGMYVTTARNLKQEDERKIIPGQEGIIAKALFVGEAIVARNLFRDPELAQFASLLACRSAICVPLRVGFDVYGVVLIGSPVADAFTDEHKELVSAVCAQAVMALQNAQLYQDLREERDKIIDRHEEARAQLARDLHDGPTQSISAIAMRLNYVKSLLYRDPIRVKKEIDDLEELARRTTREIRTMLFTLRPQILETQGLAAAVEQYVEKVQEDADFEIHLELMELGDTLDSNTQAVAFNIIEEAMNNVRKHAQCQNVWIRLALRDNLFIAEVQDDGKGFDLAATLDSYDQRGSLGLLNLQERARLVDGKSEIVTALGRGTTVTLLVPLSK